MIQKANFRNCVFCARAVAFSLGCLFGPCLPHVFAPKNFFFSQIQMTRLKFSCAFTGNFPSPCANVTLFAGWQIEFASKQNATCPGKRQHYLLGLSKTRLFPFFSAALSSRSSPPRPHSLPPPSSTASAALILSRVNAKRHFSSRLHGFHLAEW